MIWALNVMPYLTTRHGRRVCIAAKKRAAHLNRQAAATCWRLAVRELHVARHATVGAEVVTG